MTLYCKYGYGCFGVSDWALVNSLQIHVSIQCHVFVLVRTTVVHVHAIVVLVAQGTHGVVQPYRLSKISMHVIVNVATIIRPLLLALITT